MFSIMKLVLAEAAMTNWSLEVPVGTTKDDLSNPKLFTELVGRLSLMNKKPCEYPRIHVTDEEGNFFAELVVIGNAHGKVSTQVLSFVEVGSDVSAEEVDLDVISTDNSGKGSDEDGEDDDDTSDTDSTDDSHGIDGDGTDQGEEDTSDAEGTVSFEERFELAKDETQDHFIKFRGPKVKWCVVNKASTENVETDLTKEQAVEALDKYKV